MEDSGSLVIGCVRDVFPIMDNTKSSFTCLSSEVVLAFLGGGRDTGGRGCMILDV